MRLPATPYERLFRNLMFPAYETLIKRRGTCKYLSSYERSQWARPAELAALQLRNTNALLAHCWLNVPFLARHWRAHGVDDRPLTSLSELGHYPVMTKRHIIDNYEDMKARGVKSRVFDKSTGGSTGTPFKFQYDEESYARRNAVMWRGYRWCGAELGRSTAYLWGTGAPRPGWAGIKERLFHRSFNRLFLDAFGMTESNMGTFAAQLNRFKPRVVVSYVAPIVLLANWLKANNRTVHRPHTIITGAESLHASQRAIIEEVFRAPVFNTYGCREFMLLACECPERNGLHVSADHLILETVTSGGCATTGESGDVCVTDLHNHAMPFVRYLNGDRATLSVAPCACGRALPLLQSVDGRVLDIIYTRDRRAVPGEFFVYVMLDFPNVAQYQFVQQSLDKLEARLVVRPTFSQLDAERIRARLAERLGHDMSIELIRLPEIALTPSGKRRVTISELT